MMKVNVEVDCTPEEMRRLMGLPDLTPLHDKYLGLLAETMDAGAIKPEALDAMMRSWAPMGEAGLALWRRMVEAGGSQT
jgi:hypothetical protein